MKKNGWMAAFVAIAIAWSGVSAALAQDSDGDDAAFEKGDWDVAPKFSRGKVPLFPRSFIQGRKSASAVITYTVTERGKAESVTVVSTSDEKFSGHVAAAIQVWSHVPAMKDGKRIAATITREFKLEFE